MFRSTNKKKATAVLVLAMMIMALGATAAMADRKVELCHVPPGNPEAAHTIEVGPAAAAKHLANHEGDELGSCEGDDAGPGDGEGDNDNDNDNGDHDGEECETISVEIDGIEIEICLDVDVDIDIDELLEVLHILHGVDAHDRLEWLHGRLDLGERIDWLRDKVDLEDVFAKLGWLEPGAVLGLIGFLGDGAGSQAGALLDNGLLDGIVDGILDDGYEGDGDCSGLVNVCGNANGIVLADVLDVCTVTGERGFGNGPGDDANADCDVIGDEGLVGLDQLGDVFSMVGLF